MKLTCSCGQVVYYGLTHLGKEIKCKKCSAIYQIPRPRYYKARVITAIFVLICLAALLASGIISLLGSLFYKVTLPPLKEFSGPGFKINIPTTWWEESRREQGNEFSTVLSDGRNMLRLQVRPFGNLLARSALMTIEPQFNEPRLGLELKSFYSQEEVNYPNLGYQMDLMKHRLKVIGRLLVDGEKVYSLRFTLHQEISHFPKWLKQYQKLLDSFQVINQPSKFASGVTCSVSKHINLTFNSVPNNWFITSTPTAGIHLRNYQFYSSIDIFLLSQLKIPKTREFNRQIIYQNDLMRILSLALDDGVNQAYLTTFVTGLDEKKSAKVSDLMVRNLARAFPQMRWKTTNVLPIKISGQNGARFQLVYFDPLEEAYVVYLIYAIPIKGDVLLIQTILPERQFPAVAGDLNALINTLEIKPVIVK